MLLLLVINIPTNTPFVLIDTIPLLLEPYECFKMTDTDRKQLTEIIEAQIQTLNEEIAELKDLTKPIPLDAAIGRVSRMDAINNKAINDAALRDKEKLLKRLERTQDRIDEKDFGLCIKCGKEIPYGRLEYMPHTTRCVSCAG